MFYVLIHGEGQLFNKLLNHLEQHSLAQLLVELLQVKIGDDQVNRSRGSSDWDKEDTSDNNNNEGS